MSCKKCKKPEKPEQIIRITLEEWERRYHFPKYGLSVIAKNLDEAKEKIKAIVEYQNKSL